MITFDFRVFENAARDMRAAADQIPFALARSLNDGAEKARTYLADTTWPSSIKARNKSFMRAALSTSGQRASKRKLSVTLFDKLNRGHLLEHADGGTKVPRRSSIAIPSRELAAKRGAGGVPKAMRPGALPLDEKVVSTGSSANPRLIPGAIYQRIGGQKTGAGKSGKGRKRVSDTRKLKLMYILKPSVPIRADVPFEDDFNQTMCREVWRAFGPRLSAAMESRRR